MPVQLLREPLASGHLRTLQTTESWLRASQTPSPAVGRGHVPQREMRDPDKELSVRELAVGRAP
ncbi:hypothetical protein ACIQMR_29240 [Streptomyces sp. NPDC091376]|uniref:hypothetical protein n=1 Tax=Streptomyces sp. NPDC091376 TaxID=3365994 RepID=UPI0038023AD1